MGICRSGAAYKATTNIHCGKTRGDNLGAEEGLSGNCHLTAEGKYNLTNYYLCPINQNFGSKLRALTGAERRLLDTVLIHVYRARVSPRVFLAPRSLLPCFFASKRRWIFLTNRPVTGDVQVNLY
jgi:hypothetical protein